MPDEEVKTKAGLSAKLEKKDKEGKTIKTEYFFPDYDVSVEAKDRKSALKKAKKKSKKK